MERLKEIIWTPEAGETSEQRAWIDREIESIGSEKITEMTQAAIRVRELSYSPYSEFKVGAAVLSESGEIYAAPNTETVTYTETGHAEGNAIRKAISEGAARTGREFIRSIVICASGETGPCGMCRQCIGEHAVDGNAYVFSVNPEGEFTLSTSLKTLLPKAFTPAELGIK